MLIFWVNLNGAYPGYPLLHSLAWEKHLAQISIVKWEAIIKKISHDRRSKSR